MPGQCTRSRAEGDGRSAANQCCDMKADLATIGPEATLKARRCVGPTRETWFQCVRPGRQAIEDGKHPVRCYRAEYRLAGPKAVFTIDTEMGAVRAPVSCGPHRAGVYRGRSTMARCQGPAAGDRRPDGLPGPVFAGGDYGRVAQASIRDRDRPHAGQRLRDELRGHVTLANLASAVGRGVQLEEGPRVVTADLLAVDLADRARVEPGGELGHPPVRGVDREQDAV